MKAIMRILVTLIIFIIMINISLKVFNTIDAWVGIIAGLLSVAAFIYTLYRIWKRSVEDEAKED